MKYLHSCCANSFRRCSWKSIANAKWQESVKPSQIYYLMHKQGENRCNEKSCLYQHHRDIDVGHIQKQIIYKVYQLYINYTRILQEKNKDCKKKLVQKCTTRKISPRFWKQCSIAEVGLGLCRLIQEPNSYRQDPKLGGVHHLYLLPNGNTKKRAWPKCSESLMDQDLEPHSTQPLPQPFLSSELLQTLYKHWTMYLAL